MSIYDIKWSCQDICEIEYAAAELTPNNTIENLGWVTKSSDHTLWQPSGDRRKYQ